MSQNSQPGGGDILKALIEKINVQVFLFALAVIVAIAVFGGGIPAEFRALIYIVVVGGLIVYSVLVIMPVLRKLRSASPTPSSPKPSPPPAPAVDIAGQQVHIGGDVAGRDIVKNVYGDTVQAAPTPPEGLRPAYLNWLLTATRNLPLAGVDRRSISEDTRTDLDLAAVYTALMTQRPEASEHDPRKMADMRPDHEAQRLSALAVLNAEKHLALLGDPGSGKSTFVNFVTLCLTGESLGDPVANLKTLTAPLPGEDDDRSRRDKKEPAPQPWVHGPLIPARVVLRDFAVRGLPPVGQPASGDTLWKFITTELPEPLREFAKPLRDEFLKQGGLLLLDGLDEVPEADNRREQVKSAVQGLAAAFPKVCVLVTSRTYAYQKQAWKLDGFAEAVLAPFGRAQIRRFVESWYAHIGPARHLSAEEAQGRAVVLNNAIERNPRLAELATRPLLLTLMSSLHAWRGGTLPEQREQLYAEAVELLLDQWESQKVRRRPDGTYEQIQPSLAEWLQVDQKAVRGLLDRLAFEAHRDQPTLTGTADISQDKLVSGLMGLNPSLDARPNRLVEYLSVRAGLLEPRGVGVYAFPHRTFQEYLAACYLTDHDYPHQVAGLLRAEPNRWREVTLLAGAKASRGATFAAWALAEALCYAGCQPGSMSQSEADANGWGALLAAKVLVENHGLAHVADRDRPKLECIRDWLTHVVTSGSLPPVDRAQAGRALAELGDPREAIMKPDKMELCRVPAGPFPMGSADDDPQAYGDEKPQREFDIPYDYQIAKCPVTNAQFQAFVDAGGYQNKDYWTEAIAAGRWKDGKIRRGRYILDEQEKLKVVEAEEDDKPLYFGKPFNLPNHPVVGVSWYEALALTRWLTAEWRKCGKIRPDEIVRLPTEAEWEKAASWDKDKGEKRIYSWGDDPDPGKANVADAGIGSTSAVGLFPTGVSPYGCLDMTGNVWEWTQSLWGKDVYKPDFKYPYDTLKDKRENLGAGDTVLRVLRGGAWNLWDLARAASRSGHLPGSRNVSVGLRVVVSPNSRS